MTSPHSGRFPLQQNLAPLIAALRSAGIKHRVAEMNGEQVLLLADDADPSTVAALLDNFEKGELQEHQVHERAPNHPRSPIAATVGKAHLMHAPMTLLLVTLGIFGLFATEFRWLVVVDALAFASSPTLEIDTLLRGYALPWESNHWWRIFTPVFLHFSWFHILFNAGALLQVGSWLERYWGSAKYLLLCLLIGAGSNIVQYLETPSPRFGGLSGIIFGLFAFNGVMQMRFPSRAVRLPKGFYIMLLIWLVAGFTPIFQWLFGVSMANGAHLGGAVIGGLCALLMPVSKHNEADYD